MQPLPEIEQLSRHNDWIRRLARRLVPDAAAADDAVQDAWIAVLERPAAAGAPRRWLAGVVRNLARQNARGEARRSARERAAARREALPSTLAVVEELSTQRAVQSCVLELEEPYRSVLLLRYFKDLPLAAVARAQGVPVSTVHSRERRGLELLRAKLDRLHGGDRRRWALALLPFTREPAGGLATAPIGTPAMTTPLKLFVWILAAAGGLWSLWTLTADPRSEPATAEAAVVGAGGESRAALTAPLGRSARTEAGGRVPLAGGPGELQAAAPAGECLELAGRVVDVTGRGVAGVPVELEAGNWINGRAPVSDAGGAFRGEAEVARADWLQLTADHRRWFTLVPGAVGGGHGATVVVAPRCSYAGRVVDEAGEPLAGAYVLVEVERRLHRDLRLFDPWEGTERAWSGPTDEAGSFALEGVAGGPYVILHARKQGHGSLRIEAPAHSDFGLELGLFDPAEIVEGRVLDAAGGPVGGARVSFGKGIVATGADGTFAISREGSGETELVAIREGFLPGRATVVDLPDDPVTLRLGGAPHAIKGRVVDQDGRPLAGITVWIDELTPFGRHLEPGGGPVPDELSVEEAIRGGRDELRGVRTDDVGRFRLEGLLDRGYVLRALDPHRLHATETEPVRAGSRDVDLVLERSADLSRVAGVVRSPRGEPLAGIRVVPLRDIGTPWSRIPVPGGGEPYGVTTDAEGRFELGPLTRYGAHLELRRPLVAFRRYDLDGFEDLGSVEITLPLLCRVQVDLGERHDLAVRAAVRDAGGRRLQIAPTRGTLVSFPDHAPIVDGRTAVFLAPEEARTIELLDDVEDVVFRGALELDPNELNLVRP